MVAIAEQRIEANGLEWFYREAHPPQTTADRLPVILLHGLVSQSYSWREVMPALTEQGFRAIAPDWLGHGYSARPEPRDFPYTADAFVEGLAAFLQTLAIPKMHLVVQGFLGIYGLLYALKYPETVDRLIIINTPLAPTVKLPGVLSRMTLPLIGEMLTQDPLLVDRTLEGGGPYQVNDDALDVYRRPFLTTSAAGRALLATLRNLKLPTATAAIAQGLAERSGLTHLIWGVADPWLPVAIAAEWAATIPNAGLTQLDQVGHYAQEDWPEKVAEALLRSLKQLDVS